VPNAHLTDCCIHCRSHLGLSTQPGCATYLLASARSEADNLAAKGVYSTRRDRPSHIITSQIEHPTTLQPCPFLERLGAAVGCVPVDAKSVVDRDDFRRAIGPNTCLITIMCADNEVGTIQPIADIAAIAREHGILLHTHGAQSLDKIAARQWALLQSLARVQLDSVPGAARFRAISTQSLTSCSECSDARSQWAWTPQKSH
jgi:cysteine sulfinate desulfinase/cysteine desulfurase-like protein